MQKVSYLQIELENAESFEILEKPNPFQLSLA